MQGGGHHYSRTLASDIWAHLHPILNYFRQETDKTVIYLKIYGPTTQFRHKRNFNLLASKYLTFAFFLRRFSMGTVQQMVLKRSADRFVNEGWDVTKTDDLIAVLESSGTSIKLLKITEEQVKYIENELPATLNLITNKMQIYQVFTKLFFL